MKLSTEIVKSITTCVARPSFKTEPSGACTHVPVGDPTRGYGIFIENMLGNIPK